MNIEQTFKINKLIAVHAEKVVTANHWKESLNALVSVYKIITPLILAGESFDKYFIDWSKVLTPIESDVWGILRELNMNFYPQYPAHGYILDFADPVKKIGIEADGFIFHDIKRDAKRDLNLKKHGWKIYRIKGSEAFRNEYEFFEKLIDAGINLIDDHEIEALVDEWLYSTANGIIKAINLIEYGEGYLLYKNNLNYLEVDESAKASDCLEKHSLV